MLLIFQKVNLQQQLLALVHIWMLWIGCDQFSTLWVSDTIYAWSALATRHRAQNCNACLLKHCCQQHTWWNLWYLCLSDWNLNHGRGQILWLLVLLASDGHSGRPAGENAFHDYTQIQVHIAFFDLAGMDFIHDYLVWYKGMSTLVTIEESSLFSLLEPQLCWSGGQGQVSSTIPWVCNFTLPQAVCC